MLSRSKLTISMHSQVHWTRLHRAENYFPHYTVNLAIKNVEIYETKCTLNCKFSDPIKNDPLLCAHADVGYRNNRTRTTRFAQTIVNRQYKRSEERRVGKECR